MGRGRRAADRRALLAGRSLLADAGARPLTRRGRASARSSSRIPTTPRSSSARRRRRRCSAYVGDGDSGRGHWFFTPPPYWLAFAAEDVTAPDEPIGRLARARPRRAAVTSSASSRPSTARPTARSTSCSSTKGTQQVDGPLRGPDARPDTGRRRPVQRAARAPRRARRARRGAAGQRRGCDPPGGGSRSSAAGARSARSRHASGGPASALCDTGELRRVPRRLVRAGVVPGTVVIDDKWQVTLRAQRARRVEVARPRRLDRGRHAARSTRAALVESVGCRRRCPASSASGTPDGTALAARSDEPGGTASAHGRDARLVRADGLDADGLKIDFTARTPSGHALTAHAAGWGIALLHELLSLVYAEVKKPSPTRSSSPILRIPASPTSPT